MAIKITVKAGAHDRKNAPIAVALEADVAPGSYALYDGTGEIPCQVIECDGKKQALFVIANLAANTEAVYTLGEAKSFENALELKFNNSKKFDPECIDVFAHGKLFTTLHYGDAWTRPFLHPVIGPSGSNVTRTYPLVLDLPGETRDHHHQKSFWTAWGDLSVNGVEHDDNWSESWNGHGSILCKSCDIIEAGPVRGKILMQLDWLSKDGIKVMEETRTYTFYLLNDNEQAVDLKVAFKATEGDVTFGDTKEGGICAIRVASSMDATGKGTIVNSYGAVGESETWGKRAEWCDYYGPVKDGSIAGITIMDNPDNFRFPTYWHVRNYGLMTANPFGTSYFYNDKAKDGSYTIKKDALFVFQYRVFIHSGSTAEATVGNRYHDYINPAAATATVEA